MDRICQYSTIIFASNVCVLLFVAIATDYWEYRGFDFEEIIKGIPASNTTQRYSPHFTNSYLIVRYFWSADARKDDIPALPGNKVHYQSPSIVHKYYLPENVTNTHTVFNGTHNITYLENTVEMRKFEEVIVLFFQYGNLFRDCDNVGDGARRRFWLTRYRRHRCRNFIYSPRTSKDYIVQQLGAVVHLERSAFVFATVCVIASVVSVMGGSYGYLMQERIGMTVASSSALLSGVLLVVSIALFHGKCHLIHRHEYMAGLEVPYKKVLDNARIHYYGWSFVLAWLCVAMLFVLAWVWLSKAQDMNLRAHTIRPTGGMRRLREERFHQHHQHQRELHWTTSFKDMDDNFGDIRCQPAEI